MQYRIDKKSGNKLSILGFGCMRFPNNLGKIDMNKTEKLIVEAIENGINYFDTAYIYPGSEVALGHILEKYHARDRVFIATKLPLIMVHSYSDFDKYFNAQLERLNTSYIDYYFMHVLSSPEHWKRLCDLGIEKWINEKKENGQIKQLGFSFHGQRDDFCMLLDLYDWDFCQIQYNYININYQAGVTGLKKAAAKGLPVFIMEPLLGGRLATSLPEKAVELFKSENDELSPVAWALRWLWNQSEVTMLLSGMNELSQLYENLKIADTATPDMLTQKEIDTVNEVIKIFNDSYKIPCTGCNYCMPCPQKINIPECFAAYNASYSMGKLTGLQQYTLSTGATSQTPSYASNCIQCGKCEKHCPQYIPIIKTLEQVSQRMEPFWYKAAATSFRTFQNIKSRFK